MNNQQKPLARRENLVIQEASEETLIYDLSLDKAHCLNQTAAAVWKVCDGENTISDIAKTLKNDFGTNVPEDLIWLAIDQLSKENLLEREVGMAASGVTRREAIKRAGLTSMVALPVVAMLSFPQRALAVSCPVSQQGACGGCASGQICCGGTCSPVGTCAGTTCP